MIETVKKHKANLAQLPAVAKLDDSLQQLKNESQDFDRLLELLETDTFKGDPSFFKHGGRVDLAYELMTKEKQRLANLLAALGELDAYLSIAKLYKEFAAQRVRFCFPRFITSPDGYPHIDAQDFWYPMISAGTVVANSLRISGGTKTPHTIIISGPNEAGKSTLTRAFVVTAIIGQSLGIAPASALMLTPFAKIATYLNIVDDVTAGNSYFKAGIVRAREILEMSNKATEKEFCLFGLDEIFNGTSFDESQAAAYSFIKQVGNKPTNIVLTCTHYPLVTTLPSELPVFANHKVAAIIDAAGAIHRPFKLEPGVSNQHIALRILAHENFSDSFLQEAQNVLGR